MRQFLCQHYVKHLSNAPCAIFAPLPSIAPVPHETGEGLSKSFGSPFPRPRTRGLGNKGLGDRGWFSPNSSQILNTCPFTVPTIASLVVRNSILGTNGFLTRT